MLGYVNNEYPLSDSTRRTYGVHNSGYFRDLQAEHPDLATRIINLVLQYDEISDSTPAERKIYFQRLQMGKSLTAAEKNKAIPSDLSDFTDNLARHRFFTTSVAFSNARAKFFDVSSKVTALAVGGLRARMRAKDIYQAFVDHAEFTAHSPVAVNLRTTYNFMATAFPAQSPIFQNGSFTQAIITLASQLVEGGQYHGQESAFRNFAEKFHTCQARHRAGDHDEDVAKFDSLGAPFIANSIEDRHEILVKKMREWEPELAARLASYRPGAKNWLEADTAVVRLSDESSRMTTKFGTMTVEEINQNRHNHVPAKWQRDVLWGRAKRQLLIDTMLRGWKLPKFNFAHINDSSPMEIIDGQQRRAAILDFIDNKYALSKETRNRLGLKKGKFRDVAKERPELAQAFMNFGIECDVLYGATVAERKNIFIRLQNGKSLAPQEKLNAVESGLRDWCMEITAHPFFKAHTVDTKRLGNFDIASKAMIMELKGIGAPLRFRNMSEILENERGFDRTSPSATRIVAALDLLAEALPSAVQIRDRIFAQSAITLASHFVSTGRSNDYKREFGEFVGRFYREYSAERALGHRASDTDYIEFRDVSTAKAFKNSQRRHEILITKMRDQYPALASIFQPAEGTIAPIIAPPEHLEEFRAAAHVNFTAHPRTISQGVRVGPGRRRGVSIAAHNSGALARPVNAEAASPTPPDLSQPSFDAIFKSQGVFAKALVKANVLDARQFIIAYLSISGENNPNVPRQVLRRINQGDLIIPAPGGHIGFKPEADIAAAIAGQNAMEAFPDIWQHIVTHNVSADASRPPAQPPAPPPDSAWLEFTSQFPTLSQAADVKNLDNLFQLVRVEYPKRATFDLRITQAVKNGPYDTETGNANPVLVAIARKLGRDIDSLLPEHRKNRDAVLAAIVARSGQPAEPGGGADSPVGGNGALVLVNNDPPDFSEAGASVTDSGAARPPPFGLSAEIFAQAERDFLSLMQTHPLLAGNLEATRIMSAKDFILAYKSVHGREADEACKALSDFRDGNTLALGVEGHRGLWYTPRVERAARLVPFAHVNKLLPTEYEKIQNYTKTVAVTQSRSHAATGIIGSGSGAAARSSGKAGFDDAGIVRPHKPSRPYSMFGSRQKGDETVSQRTDSLKALPAPKTLEQ
ncbi:MAG: DUF262 domain-containing protein [Bdellovibrionales bacterium]